MKLHLLRLIIVLTLIFSSKEAYSVEQPLMESALGNLRQVVSSEKESKTTHKLELLNSAREDLLKAPSIYDGQKAKARKCVELAIEQLKAGEEAKALASTQRAMDLISDGIEYIANRDKSPSEGESGKGKKSSKDYFGTPK